MKASVQYAVLTRCGLDASQYIDDEDLIGMEHRNLNQIAKRVNSTGHLYEEDIADLKTRYGELWGAFGSLLSKLEDL